MSQRPEQSPISREDLDKRGRTMAVFFGVVILLMLIAKFVFGV